MTVCAEVTTNFNFDFSDNLPSAMMSTLNTLYCDRVTELDNMQDVRVHPTANAKAPAVIRTFL